jgi:hypothetical protein
MTREELIQELDNSGCPVCRDCHILESVDKYIKSEKRLLLEKIGKPLREAIVAYPNHECMGCRAFVRKIVDEALAIIEKEGSL